MKQAVLPWAAHAQSRATGDDQQPRDPNHDAANQHLPPSSVQNNHFLDPALFGDQMPSSPFYSTDATGNIDPDILQEAVQTTPSQSSSQPLPYAVSSNEPSQSSEPLTPNANLLPVSSTHVPTASQNGPQTSQSSTASLRSEDQPSSAPTLTQPQQSLLYPLFHPGAAASSSTSSSSSLDSEDVRARPVRSARSKGPQSYREDLKAVLRADAKQEAAFVKQTTQKPQSCRKPKKTQSQDFELVEANVTVPPPGETKPPKPTPKPLSLAVKGTTNASASSPHPFFAKKVKPTPIPTAPVLVPDSASANEVKNLEDSTSSENQVDKGKEKENVGHAEPTAAPRWSLFSARKATPSKPKKPTMALWPTSQDSHVTGLRQNEAELVSRLQIDLSSFRTRWFPPDDKGKKRASGDPRPTEDGNFLRRLNAASHSDSSSDATLTSKPFDSIDDFIAQQVDVSNLGPYSARSCDHQLWTDAWRPHSASQCLGNEKNAQYLVDWLRRLLVAAPGAIQSDRKRRPDIQRRVDRKKRRRREDSEDSSMADFIVDDDDEDDLEDEQQLHKDGQQASADSWFGKFGKIGDTDDEEEKMENGISIPPSQESLPKTSSQKSRVEEWTRLTNCIVLRGPSGSGKTAAVYACASELGYEVFELYPGMGRRAGKDMLGAVGDLGTNHMVSSGGSGGGATWKPNATPRPRSDPNACSSSAVAVRQSLILIEEADILFEDDKGFWSAVVQLVAESKRPVIITCNEPDLVPTQDLPIQEILNFERPTIDQAIPYLQVAAAHSGLFYTEEQIQDLCCSTSSARCDSSQDQGRVDVRQAMNQLQFGCSVHTDESEIGGCLGLKDVHAAADSAVPGDEEYSGRDLVRNMAKFSDALSVADVLGSSHEVEAFGDNGVEHQPIRQLGSWVQLVPQPLGRPTIRACGETMKRDIVQQARNLIGADLSNIAISTMMHRDQDSKEGTERARSAQLSLMYTVLDPLLVPFCQSVDNFVLDYAPMVRIMALVDQDLFEIHQALRLRAVQESQNKAALEQSVGGGRNTRNSAASRLFAGSEADSGYVRWLPLGPEEIRAVRQSALIWTE